jgi:predicted ribosome quality control (RQC) complex YloA/Tae2 family protein
MEYYDDNKIKYIVGKSAENNWKIIQNSEKDYYWIHANNKPSTHVIICIDKPLESEIKYACNLCKINTNGLNNTITPIKYIGCYINNIKLGSKPGEVTFKSYDNCNYHIY